MDFKQIEAFVNVVRYKSFSKAADATFFTQPTLSTHISNLENELGVKLLDRNNRTIEMTPQGAQFYSYAVEMINVRSQAMEKIGGERDSVEGILEIQASSIPAATFLPVWMTEFKEIHGNVQYYLNSSDTNEVVENIIERRGDVGFIGDKINNSSLDIVKIATDKVVLISPKSYGLSEIIEIEELIKIPFIWRETGSATRKNFENSVMSLGYEKASFRIAGLFNDINSIIRSVEVGLGVTILSEQMAQNLGENVMVSTIKNFNDNRAFYMIKSKNATNSSVTEAFCEFVRSKSKNK